MSKVLDEIDAKYAGKLATEHVYLEEHPEAAEQHNPAGDRKSVV